MRCFWLAAAVAVFAAAGCDDGKGEMFPDPAFKACVEDRIAYAVSIGLWQKDDPDIYNKVTMLECYGGGVKSIKGIEHMPNMDDLSIVDNQIESLEPLRTLTKLEFLKLNNNKIKDLEPLSGLKMLYNLYLADNYIEDISPLCALTQIRTVMLSGNCITDVNQFRELENCASEYSSNGAENYQEPAKCQ